MLSLVQIKQTPPHKRMQNAQSSIAEDLNKAVSLSTILNYYIEDHVKDQHLINVSIGLTEILGVIEAKYTRQSRKD